MDIADWRRKIDEIDTAMLQLLNRRAEHSLEVARLKNLEGLALRAPARERAIVSRMKRLNSGPFDAQAIGKIYGLILAESIRTQERHCGAGAAAAKRSSGSRAKQATRGRKKRT
jgi:chorismate mutase